MIGECETLGINICEVAHNSADYEATVTLRYEILRKPLGLSFSPQQLAAEDTSYHLVCRLGEELVGCLVLAPKTADQVQMRQVAVRADFQHQGIGQALVRYSERFAYERGFREIMLHARENAVGFYKKLGYRTQDEQFFEIGLPHWHMTKPLVGEGVDREKA